MECFLNLVQPIPGPRTVALPPSSLPRNLRDTELHENRSLVYDQERQILESEADLRHNTGVGVSSGRFSSSVASSPFEGTEGEDHLKGREGSVPKFVLSWTLSSRPSSGKTRPWKSGKPWSSETEFSRGGNRGQYYGSDGEDVGVPKIVV